MKLIYISLMCIGLAGCGADEFGDLRDFVANSGADMRGNVPPAPAVKVYEPFAYVEELTLTDPFQARKPELATGGHRGDSEPDVNRPREALEEFSLESLKMVGYVSKGAIGHAVVRAPDKKLYQVRVGNYVGMNFGLVKKVSEAEVVIKEVVQDSAGDWAERSSSLQLVDKE